MVRKFVLALAVAVAIGLPVCRASVAADVTAAEEPLVSVFDDFVLLESNDKGLGVLGGYEEGGEMFCPYGFYYNSIPADFISYVGDGKFEEYLASLNRVDSGGGFTRSLDFSLPSFLSRFNISKDDFKRIYPNAFVYGHKNNGINTDAMIDALYSDDAQLKLRAFPNPCTTLHYGKVYTLAWIASHTTEDYKNHGLPVEKVIETVERCLDGNLFKTDAKNIAGRLIDEGYKVNLPPKYSFKLTTAGTGREETIKRYDDLGGLYEEWDAINITAEKIEGFTFVNWTSSNGGRIMNTYGSATQFIMPPNNAVVTAHYRPKY